MWEKLVSWFKSLFGSEAVPKEHDEVVVVKDPQFSGWIKDEQDSRDQIFGEQK